MFGDICSVLATRNPAPGAKFFLFLISDINDVQEHLRGVGDIKSGTGAKFFQYFFLQIFDIGDVRGRLRVVVDSKSGTGAKFFRSFFMKIFDIGDFR